MVVNKTGFTNVESIDSTLDKEAVQRVRTDTECAEIGEQLVTFTSCLVQEGLIHSDSRIEKRVIVLEVTSAGTNEHSLMDYKESPVATASYRYYPEHDISQVGTLYVSSCLRGYGIGTQMKRQIDNHMKQEGSKESYTWIASEEGRKLAKKTGYRTDNNTFDDVDEIWSKRL